MSQTNNTFGQNSGGLQIGQNSGTIHFASQAQARPETPPRPSSSVPFTPDPNYIDRPALTDDIHTRLSRPAGRVALVGLGGIGKSQLAIEASKRLRHDSPQTWVLWLHASGAGRFEQSLRDVADQVKIPGRADPTANLPLLLKAWLRDESKGRWLMVLDNADDARFLTEAPEVSSGMQLFDYIPSCDHGSVLITTRSKTEALRLVHDEDIVSVLPMSEDEAESLLSEKLNNNLKQAPCQALRKLATALDCMPLAITQAAAFIRQRGARSSVDQYLEEFERSRAARSRLLQRPVSVVNRDREANNSILLTWQISFEHIRNTSRSAADLLSLMSFCDRVAIPEILLRARNDGEDGSDGESASFEDDIVTLYSFSFISERTDGQSWEMHRLVQEATQIWLKDHGRLDDTRDHFICELHAAFPNPRFEYWPRCRVLYPHARAAMHERPASKKALLQLAEVMYYAAWYAKEQGDYADALSMAEIPMTTMSAQLGAEDGATLRSSELVAMIYDDQGRWKDAEELQVKILESSRAQFGGRHEDTVDAMSNLAVTYHGQARWKEAEELRVKVMEACKTVLDKEHDKTLNAMSNLAMTYDEQGRFQEAEALEVEVLETRRRVLGAEHPVTLSSMDRLAATYCEQGRFQGAEALQVEVLKARRRVLGAEHPDTSLSMNNLAVTYQKQGRLEEAEALQVEALGPSKKVLGVEHPQTLDSMHNLATIWAHQDRREEAEQLLVQVADARRRVIGNDHTDTLRTASTLAWVRVRRQGASARRAPDCASEDRHAI